jgi:hypothetical protein
MSVFINYRLELTPMEEITKGDGSVEAIQHSGIPPHVITGHTDKVADWDKIGILEFTFSDNQYYTITELLQLSAEVSINFLAFKLTKDNDVLRISFDNGTTDHVEISANEQGFPIPFAQGITTDDVSLQSQTDVKVFILYQRM